MKKKTKVLIKRIVVIVILVLMCVGMAAQMIGFKVA